MYGNMIFVENGGRTRKEREPRIGEPFYGEYMKQYITKTFHPGDKISVLAYDTIITGTVLLIGPSITIMESIGQKKSRKKKTIPYRSIQNIRMYASNENPSDMTNSVPDDTGKNDLAESKKKAEESEAYSQTMRNASRKDFESIYPDNRFDESYIICVPGGCQLFYPFQKSKVNDVKASVFVIAGEEITDTPYPNKNCYSAYNGLDQMTQTRALYLSSGKLQYHNRECQCCMYMDSHNTSQSEQSRIKDCIHVPFWENKASRA